MVQSNDNVVSVARLTKVFRDFWLREKVTAVCDLNLEIHPHEVFGLLGPNGSGKSTALKMILGLLFPTRGQIRVFGRGPTDVYTKARIGFLPEESYLYPFLDAHETLDFYGRLFHQNRRERRRRIDMLLDMVGLSAVAYRRVGEYSKGMQRRIGLAQALINDPDLLILDEPTSGMDPIGTRQFKDLIVTLAKRGKTVLLSSHLLADVEDVCDRICILYGGKMQACGRIGDLLAHQDWTQLTTDRLDEATIQQVRLLLERSGVQLREVSIPRDRLESLFLRIVQEAQDQRVTTGGAVAGGEVAEFLRGEEGGRAIIEKLVAAVETVEPAPPPAAAPEPVRAAKAAREVLRTLVDPVEPAEPAEPAAPAAPGPAAPARAAGPQRPAKADRKIIDDLLDGGAGGSQES